MNKIKTVKIVEMLANDNSYNIGFKINGYEIIDITPIFNKINIDTNSITAKNIGNNQILIQGTSNAQTDIALKGAFRNSEILSRIPANSLVKYFIQNDCINDVLFQVFNITNVLTGKSYVLTIVDDETNITGLVLRIPAETTINKLLSPRILVIKNTI